MELYIERLSSTLTDISRKKLKEIKLPKLQDKFKCFKLKNLVDNMLIAFKNEIEMKMITPMNIDQLKKLFINFDIKFNHDTPSYFQIEIAKMNYTYSFELMVNKGIIKIHFLGTAKGEEKLTPTGYMASILHAINTFVNMYQYDYRGLVIYISLDSNVRTIDKFNVCGVTIRSDHLIILTRSQEIIKLLFHELVHYIDLHSGLNPLPSRNFKLNIVNELILTSEVYAEFMSILLNTAYESIHLSRIINLPVYQIFQWTLEAEIHYSIYLTANILKLYQYDVNNYKDFFNMKGDQKYCRISIWEYVVLRTQLLLNLDLVCNLVDANWTNIHDINQMTDLMKPTDKMIYPLKEYMTMEFSRNVPYTLINLDWNLV